MGSKAAKEKIVSDNTGLVWSIARRFVNRGYDLEELYQIGCIGLLKACDRFESRYGVQFSTYAVPLIAGEIKRFLRESSGSIWLLPEGLQSEGGVAAQIWKRGNAG